MTSLSVRITHDSQDGTENEPLMRRLHGELTARGVPVEKVGSAPTPGGKGANEVMEITALLITYLEHRELLRAATTLIADWAKRQNACRIELSIDGDKIMLDGLSRKQMERLNKTERQDLLNEFLKRHEL